MSRSEGRGERIVYAIGVVGAVVAMLAYTVSGLPGADEPLVAGYLVGLPVGLMSAGLAWLLLMAVRRRR